MIDSTPVRVKKLNPLVPLPRYASSGAAGADIHAFISQAITIDVGKRALIPTGLAFDIPAGFEIQVRSRSGAAIRDGVFVVNSPGTIDSDYRGEVKIILGNIGETPIIIQPFDRIAQIVLCPVYRANWELSEELDSSARSDGGFGSTGR